MVGQVTGMPPQHWYRQRRCANLRWRTRRNHLRILPVIARFDGTQYKREAIPCVLALTGARNPGTTFERTSPNW